MAPSGNVYYQDDYGQIYNMEWTTTNGVLDITTVISQPYVWGEANSGYIKNGILYRQGIITVDRQVIKQLQNGYQIIAEGTSQIVDFIQTNFPCESGPIDTFKYHLNYNFDDHCCPVITTGSRWADPDDPNDTNVLWEGTITSVNGVVSTVPGDTVGTVPGITVFEFTDVWSL